MVKTETLVERFDEAAQRWGWEQDQGHGRGVDRAKADYERVKALLLSRIKLIEARAK